MQEFGDAVQQCAHCDGMVIDLRGNPGGIGAMAMGMAGWLVKQTGERLGVMYMRGATLNFFINPRAEAFEGPVAVLVDGSSASTSEIFAGGLKDLGRARIFGTRTAAAALPSVITRLPNGDGFQYAVANYISAGRKGAGRQRRDSRRGSEADPANPARRTRCCGGCCARLDTKAEGIAMTILTRLTILGALAGSFRCRPSLCPKPRPFSTATSKLRAARRPTRSTLRKLITGTMLLPEARIERQAYTLCYGPRQRILGGGTRPDRQD